MRISGKAIAIVIAALAGGCVNHQSAKNGAIRLFNGVPDGPLLTLRVDGTIDLQNVDFGAGTGYFVLGAGTYHVTVEQAAPYFPLPPDPNNPPVPAPVLDLPGTTLLPNDELTIVAVGRVADGSLDYVSIPTRTTFVPAGQTRVQFVHAAACVNCTPTWSGQPAVDVYITDAGASLAGATPQFSALNYKDATVQKELASRLGTGVSPAAEIRLTVVGDPNTVLFDSGPTGLPAEGDLLYEIVENLGPGSATHPLSLAVLSGTASGVLLDRNLPANVRVAHASPNTGPVDFTIDDAQTPANVILQVTGLAYLGVDPGQNAYREVPATVICATVTATCPGVYTDKFLNSASPDPNSPLATLTSVYLPGSSVTRILDGPTTGLGALTLADNPRRDATAGRIRLVNAYADPAATTTLFLDIYIAPHGTDITPTTVLAIGTSTVLGFNTSYIFAAPGDYDITLITAGSKNLADIKLQKTLTVEANKVYTGVIVAASGGGLPLGLMALDDFPAGP